MEVTACGICGSSKLDVILDMGKQPLAERESELYPLVLLQCADCSLVQLSYIADQREMFPPDHPYATGNTKFLREYFTELGYQLNMHALDPGELVVDIGANDGTLLASLRADVRKVAVEPTNQAQKCRVRGFEVYQKFWTKKVASQILNDYGSASVITACNVLAHVPDPHDFLDGVAMLLHHEGIFITENHDVASITDGLQIDTVYHEHLRYYSVASLSKLLSMHGLEVVSAEPVPTHGGSIRVTAKKQKQYLSDRARYVSRVLHDLIEEAASQGSIYGVGACTRATPLIHYADIAGFIDCVCEVPGSEKIGRNMPGTQIRVIDEAALIEDQPEYALLFAWHLKDSLIPKLRKAGYNGQFIIPLPEPGITHA